MKIKKLLFSIPLFVLCSVAIQSCCLEETEINNLEKGSKGVFTVSEQDSYTIAMTRSQSISSTTMATTGNMTASLVEEPWEKSCSTRSNISGNEYIWGDGACISLYMTESGKNNVVTGLYDIPFDPNTYHAYTKYKPYKDVYDSIQKVDEQSVANTAFFFKDKIGIDKTSLVDKKLDFYGYYPRPYDKTNNNLYYVKTSIIDVDDAHEKAGGDWNKLSYSFEDIQTDENLSFHDVMCAFPETVEANDKNSHRYGNENKGANDNVQLLFKHMFCLLNIEIAKGDSYDSDGNKKCEISEIEISGSEVSTQGILDVKACKIETIPMENAVIKRLFTDISIKDAALTTSMIVQPISEPAPGLADENKQKRFVLTCVVDGIPFSCSMPDIKLEAGKKYNLKLKLAPNGGFVFRIWDGAKVTVDGKEYSAGEYFVPKMQVPEFKVSQSDNANVWKVLCNGENITNSTGKYEVTVENNNKVYYDIVASPSKWYVTPENMRMHYDAIWNNKYGKSVYDSESSSWNKCTMWSDLTGNGNDGTLKMFDNTNSSGWYDKGLWFDGLDDIVTYSGSINPTVYTMEFYIMIDGKAQKSWARMTAEGNLYPCYYVSGNVLQLYAHGLQGYLYQLKDENKKQLAEIAQLDFVFDAEKEYVTVYIDGEFMVNAKLPNCRDAVSIPIASLGNRIQDNTRALRATYYSFIVYDTALTKEQVKQNYELNVLRYKSN